ncbi:uncharacterized protein LOC117109657 [Anneissia japonica]|uniref:uncharacterized protein LOC117109657 n=1 Tax=Anneissia japonica TaxID=1529436 RepID=UPI0014259954|nr:uncharacterized protein LOC117109657 [Anneissia japonica]
MSMEIEATVQNRGLPHLDTGLPNMDTGLPNSELEPSTGDGPTSFQQNTPLESATQPRLDQNPMKLGSMSKREEIQELAQQLINNINVKRKSDATLIVDFKKDLLEKVTESCKTLDLYMFQCYERNGSVMHSKLQALFATLERIHKLELELDEFKQALGVFYNDIHYDSHK